MSAGLIVGIFVVWFGLTVLGQFYRGRWFLRLKSHDQIGILPHYRLFDRSVRNIVLFYRDTLETPWREYPCSRKASWRQAVWNPEGHDCKVIWRFLRAFSDAYSMDIDVPVESVVYQGVLQLLARDTECQEFVQFLIVERDREIYCSHLVRIGG